MRDENKKGLRWMIFKLFGPTEVQNLINHIDDISQDGSDVMIIPTGEYQFHVKTSEGDNPDPFIFPTPMHREMFQSGMNFGITLMGGSTRTLSKNTFDMIENMEKKSTHGGGGGKLN